MTLISTLKRSNQTSEANKRKLECVQEQEHQKPQDNPSPPRSPKFPAPAKLTHSCQSHNLFLPTQPKPVRMSGHDPPSSTLPLLHISHPWPPLFNQPVQCHPILFAYKLHTQEPKGRRKTPPPPTPPPRIRHLLRATRGKEEKSNLRTIYLSLSPNYELPQHRAPRHLSTQEEDSPHKPKQPEPYRMKEHSEGI